MIIYGINSKLVAQEQLFDACSTCSGYNCVELFVFQKYLHLFWIPFIPIQKSGLSECNSCHQKLKHKQMMGALKTSFQNLKSRSRTPIWTWSGLIILISFIYFIAAEVQEDKKKLMQSVSLIEAGDVIEVKNTDKQFTLLIIDSLKNDSVYYRNGLLLASKRKGLKDMIKLGENGFVKEQNACSKSKLKEWVEQDVLYKIIKKNEFAKGTLN